LTRAVDPESMDENTCSKHKQCRVDVDDQNDCFFLVSCTSIPNEGKDLRH
jgi:hypothetical protein